MKNFLPGEYKKNEKLKINHSYLVEQFADYTKVFKEIEKVVPPSEVDQFSKIYKYLPIFADSELA